MAHVNNRAQKLNVAGIVNPCTSCGEEKSNSFYKSFNAIQKKIGRFTVCKSCMEIEYQKYLAAYNDGKLALYYFCRKFDIYFSTTAYEGAVNNSASTGWTVLQSYFKQINSFRNKETGISRNGYGVCFDESTEFLDRVIVETDTKEAEDGQLEKLEVTPEKKEYKPTELDKQNKSDVIRLIKYDPFFDEPDDIKSFLYNKLVDFLDENTLSDSFKLPIVIEMVKGFGQAERINRALSQIDIMSETTKVDDIKKLSDTKQNILRSILSMAKDNGISENYSNSKSKGAGTLSGIIKDLQEKGIHSAEVNLYDIETCAGMKQVADISNASILEQLMLNENDYVDMIKDQRALIQELDGKASRLEEENRILKVKLKEMEEFFKNNKLSNMDGGL